MKRKHSTLRQYVLSYPILPYPYPNPCYNTNPALLNHQPAENVELKRKHSTLRQYVLSYPILPYPDLPCPFLINHPNPCCNTNHQPAENVELKRKLVEMAEMASVLKVQNTELERGLLDARQKGTTYL